MQEVTEVSKPEKLRAVKQRPKLSLDRAYAELAALCREIDEGADLSDALVAHFNETKLATTEAIDRRIAFLTAVKGQIPEAKAMRDAWAAHAKMLEQLEAAMKTATKELLEAHPDLPREGTIGRLAVEANGGVAPLELAFGDKDLTPETIELFGIEPRFVASKTVYWLDTDAVRAALEAGEQLDWAFIGVRGTHLKCRAGVKS